MARKQTPLKNTKRHVVRLAEIAFNELSLPGSLHSKADEERLWRIFRGLKWLDDDQAQLRGKFTEILADYDKDHDAKALVARLRKLQEIQPGDVPKEQPPKDPLEGMTQVHFGVWGARETDTHERWWQVTWKETVVRFGIRQDEAITLAQYLATKIGQGWSAPQARSFARRLDVGWRQMNEVVSWLGSANIETVVDWALEPSGRAKELNP